MSTSAFQTEFGFAAGSPRSGMPPTDHVLDSGVFSFVCAVVVPSHCLAALSGGLFTVLEVVCRTVLAMPRSGDVGRS
jgi:hypothetical protein